MVFFDAIKCISFEFQLVHLKNFQFVCVLSVNLLTFFGLDISLFSFRELDRVIPLKISSLLPQSSHRAVPFGTRFFGVDNDQW